MSRTAHRTTISVLVVLVVIMGVLLLRGPRFSVSGTDDSGGRVAIPDLHVTCGPVLTVGWPTDGAILNDTPHSTTSFHVEPSGTAMGDRQDAILSAFDQQCNERRDTNIAFLIILAIPVCLLGALLVARRPESDAVEPDHPAAP